MNRQPTSAPSATSTGKPVPSQPHRWLHFWSKLLHAFVIASGVIAALWFAAGLLQSADVIEIPANQALLLVFPGIFLVYGIVKLILMWRDVWGRA